MAHAMHHLTKVAYGRDAMHHPAGTVETHAPCTCMARAQSDSMRHDRVRRHTRPPRVLLSTQQQNCSHIYTSHSPKLPSYHPKCPTPPPPKSCGMHCHTAVTALLVLGGQRKCEMVRKVLDTSHSQRPVWACLCSPIAPWHATDAVFAAREQRTAKHLIQQLNLCVSRARFGHSIDSHFH